MLAPRLLPPAFADWNARWHAPNGRSSPIAARVRSRPWLRRRAMAMRYLGPFAYQPNNSTRQFEYPWAYSEIAEHCAATGGRALRVVDIGGSLGGLQWVLARDGHDVVNVDPGLEARGVGWDVNAASHDALSHAFRAPVRLIPSTLANANLEAESADVLLSVSTLEHFAPSDLAEFATHAARILRPDGIAVLTIDLFLDVRPFAPADHNEYGTNVDVHALLAHSGLTLHEGRRTELFGFPEFSAPVVLEHLSSYLIGVQYPALAQCLVARAPG
jgi:2-polyprenyl-3-methyl-5-hydroxy-6-metoxy-1,4-benzoquinol methylase